MDYSIGAGVILSVVGIIIAIRKGGLKKPTIKQASLFFVAFIVVVNVITFILDYMTN